MQFDIGGLSSSCQLFSYSVVQLGQVAEAVEAPLNKAALRCFGCTQQPQAQGPKLIQFQDGKERRLRHFDIADLTHAFLTSLLFLK